MIWCIGLGIVFSDLLHKTRRDDWVSFVGGSFLFVVYFLGYSE